MRNSPRLSIVDAAVAPAVWAEPRRPVVIVSRQLAETLNDDQLRYVIAHEPAHYARGDQWSNLFAFLASTLLWWHPVAWLARCELSLAAEASCDAIVLEMFSGSRKPYAQTLLTVVDFIHSGKLLRPSLAMPFGGSSSLRRRIQMLGNSNVKAKVSCGGRCLLAFAALTLILVPVRAQEPQTAPQPKPAVAVGGPSSDDAAPVAEAHQQAAAVAQPGKYFVVGTVVEKASGRPIADASIQFLVAAERDPDKRVLKTTTDVQGRYRLETPLGKIQLRFPELKPGYWLEPENAIKSLATSPDRPEVRLDIAAKQGPAWPVQVDVEGGLPENARPLVSVMEVEDDALRKKVVNREPASLMKSPSQTLAWLGADGRGAFTQCGASGKLCVSLGVDAAGAEFEAFSAEMLVDPHFDVAEVKQAKRLPGTDKVELIDQQGAKATIEKAEVAVTNGQPLVRFHLRRSKLLFQEFTGRVVDAAGRPLADVRVGTAIGSQSGSGESSEATNTDREGRFRLRVRQPEPATGYHLMLVFNKDGYAAFDSSKLPFSEEQTEPTDAGTFAMPAGYSLPVRVVDESGRPLAGAILEPGGNYALRRQAIRTDEQGRGVLRNLPAGVVGVDLSHADLNKRRELVVSSDEAENTEVELQLKPAADIPAARAKSPKPIAVGQVAPELALAEWTDGKPHRLADYRGQVVVLDFWGVWCGGCVESIPVMKELADKYEPQGVVFLAIHTPDGKRDQINKLRKLKAWNAACGIDRGATTSDGESSRRYGVSGYPSVIVIDPEGRIAFNSGAAPQDRDAFMKEMQQLAESLQIPWPLPEDGDRALMISHLIRLNVARLGREIEKTIAAAKR